MVTPLGADTLKIGMNNLVQIAWCTDFIRHEEREEFSVLVRPWGVNLARGPTFGTWAERPIHTADAPGEHSSQRKGCRHSQICIRVQGPPPRSTAEVYSSRIPLTDQIIPRIDCSRRGVGLAWVVPARTESGPGLNTWDSDHPHRRPERIVGDAGIYLGGRNLPMPGVCWTRVRIRCIIC